MATRRLILLLAGLFALAGGAAYGQPPASIREDFARAVELADRSVVLVSTRPDVCEPTEDAPPDSQSFHNTGFFVGTEGEVLTTLLGVAGCGHIRITYRTDAGLREVPASVKAVDQLAGLALLKCELEGTTPLEMASPVPEGNVLVLATRDPRGRLLVQPGLVMPRREDLRLNGVPWRELPVTVLFVKPGAAAAPMLDANGRLCAVVLAVRARGEELPDAGLCYLLPADRLEPIIRKLMQGKSRRLGWLGVAVMREPENREGVKVAGVLEDSPAHDVGIRPSDELLQIGGEVIESRESFAETVCHAKPGEKLQIKLRREDRILTVSPTVGARPLLICGSPPPLPTERNPALSQAEVLKRLAEENRRLRREIQRLQERLPEPQE